MKKNGAYFTQISLVDISILRLNGAYIVSILTQT